MSGQLNEPRPNITDVTWEGQVSSPYTEDYFLHGKKCGVSLYENYRWMPELTTPMVKAIIDHLGIQPSDTILDFGCARGYVVRAFRELGYEAYGYDVSEWAIANADPYAAKYLTNSHLSMTYDWIIAKDVLEHVANVQSCIDELTHITNKGVFAVVPLSHVDGERYVVRCYEKDVTHIHRLTLATWTAMFVRSGWVIEGSYRVQGVKDNYARFERGNGFLTCRRLGCQA